MYITVMEWDGNKPPTTFYQRMKKMGLKVRGEKGSSPIDRRISDMTEREDHTSMGGRAVIVQEGAVFCASESLAHLIATLATEHGAKFVAVGNMDIDLDKSYQIQPDDYIALDRIEKTFGRMGRPAANSEHDYVVTCYEQARSFRQLQVRYVAVCPFCGGTKIARHINESIPEVPYFEFSGYKSLWKFWRDSRFFTGHFVVPMHRDSLSNTGMKMKAVTPDDPTEATMFTIFDVSKLDQTIDVLQKANYPPHKILPVLDAIFCARIGISPERRSKKRVETCVLLAQEGVDTKHLEIMEGLVPDLFDAASIISPIITAKVIRASIQAP